MEIGMAFEEEKDESQQQPKRIKKFYPSMKKHSIHRLPKEIVNKHWIDRLPKEIVIEILLKLPVKCILRCKSVCKSWYSLVSDPYFVKSHLTLSTSRNDYVHHRLMFVGCPRNHLKTCALYDVMHDKSINLLELDYPLEARLLVVGSCNGLLCLKERGNVLHIWNPSTRRSNRLPYYGFSAEMYGFGYNESSEDYEVVVVSRDLQNGTKMYSLKSAKWDKIGDFPFYVSPSDYSGVFFNGALHWAVWPNSHYSSSAKIVSLDLATKTYGEVPQPECDRGSFYMTIGASRDCLFLLYNNRPSHTDVWMMKVYGDRDSWTKLISIRNEYIFLGPPTPCFAEDGKILLQCGPKLVLCDVEKGFSSKIKNYDRFFKVLPWTIVESLVSPDGPQRHPWRRRSKSFKVLLF